VDTIPAPTSSEVATVLRTVNPTTAQFERVDPAFVKDIAAIKPTITNSFEIGYKGLVAGRLVTSVDVWHRRIKDFVGPLRVETPNVFFDPATLQAYLQSFGISGLELIALTGAIASIPVGTVTPENAEDPADLFLTYRNFGDVDLTGADFSLEWLAGRDWTVGVSYSYVSKDFFPDEGGISDIALNAPRHKAGGHLRWADERRGLTGGARVRFVDTFPVNSGAFAGVVEHYTLVDLSGSWALPASHSTTLSFDVQNLFDHPHREFVGVPELRRVGVVRLTQRF
jgi:iron complex outermembrane receptor protein